MAKDHYKFEKRRKEIAKKKKKEEKRQRKLAKKAPDADGDQAPTTEQANEFTGLEKHEVLPTGLAEGIDGPGRIPGNHG